MGPDVIMQKKKQYMVPCVYHFYSDPPQIISGKGVYLYDHKGKKYMDLYSGVSVHALGHCNPEITDTICRQVKTLQHTTTIYLTEPIVNLAEQLAAILPGKLCRTFFCCSGSEANEGAALLATLFTGRSEFLALQNSLHGRTKLCMSLTGLSFWQTDPDPVAGITHVPPPDCFHCPFSQSYGSCDFKCLKAVESAIRSSTNGKPAAMFIEPVQGNGGIIVPPPEYFPELRKILDKYEVLLIADEVQTGFGRTGKIFAVDNWGVVPDIITGGKALGAATPIGFFATTDEIAASYTRPGASTFGGNPVTAQAALKFLEILQRDNLTERCAQLGGVLKGRLENIARQFDFIAHVRGQGLMIGVEVTDSKNTNASELTDMILEQMKNAGFFLGKTGPGRNVLTFMPPLIIEESELIEAVNAFENVLQKI
jgi:4-aminobutyrate aminotransferase/4-aminobutyrate aminotransferase/(S)-3-amino-2-methylpropionate transaminase